MADDATKMNEFGHNPRGLGRGTVELVYVRENLFGSEVAQVGEPLLDRGIVFSARTIRTQGVVAVAIALTACESVFKDSCRGEKRTAP